MDDKRGSWMSCAVRTTWAHTNNPQPSALTVFAVVGDLHLALLWAQQRLGHLGHRVPAGELAVQEVTGARLLHDVRPGEARHLAEAVVTVDDSAVLHAGIGYDEFLVCGGLGVEGEKKENVYSFMGRLSHKQDQFTAVNHISIKIRIYQWVHSNKHITKNTEKWQVVGACNGFKWDYSPLHPYYSCFIP